MCRFADRLAAEGLAGAIGEQLRSQLKDTFTLGAGRDKHCTCLWSLTQHGNVILIHVSTVTCHLGMKRDCLH